MGRHDRKFHCAVMKFTQPRIRFLAAAISNFLQNFDGTKWGVNGPVAFGRTAEEHPELVCADDNRDHFSDGDFGGDPGDNHDEGSSREWVSAVVTNGLVNLPSSHSNCSLNPLPNEAFAPVSWKTWDEVCFRDGSLQQDQARALIARSFAVHLNNRKTGSKLQNMEYRRGSLCDVVLSSFCKVCLTIT